MKQLIITARELREYECEPDWARSGLTDTVYAMRRAKAAGFNLNDDISREDTPEGHIIFRQRERPYVPPRAVDDDGAQAIVDPLMYQPTIRYETRPPLLEPVTIALLVLGAGIVAAIVLTKLGIL